ncbi:MAG: hypothetical protein ACPGVG_06125 [Mycobacterium sp.]
MTELVREVKQTNSLLGKILKSADRQREESRKAAQGQQQASGQGQRRGGFIQRLFGGGRQGSGGGGGQGGQSRAERMAEEQEKSAGGGGLAGAAVGLISGAIQGAVTPGLTRREREYMVARSTATEGSAGFAIEAAKRGGADTAMQMRVGDAAANAAGALVDNAFHPVLEKTKMMRGGYADLEQMAGAGVEISDEMMARRTASLSQQADRRYQFQQRTTAAISGAQGGAVDFNPQQMLDNSAIGASSNEELKSMVQEFQRNLQGLNTEVSRTTESLRSNNDDAYRATSP